MAFLVEFMVILAAFSKISFAMGSSAGSVCRRIFPLNGSETSSPAGKDVCIECLFPENCASNNTCSPGTMGSFCEKCDTNFYRMGSVCLECPAVPWSALSFCVYMLIFSACCFFYGIKESVCTKSKLLIHYLQLMVLTSHIKIVWPNLLLQMVSVLNFGVFNTNVLIPGCTFRSFNTMTVHYLEWFSSLCIPFVVFVIWKVLDRSLDVMIKRSLRQKEERSDKRRKMMEQRLTLRRFVCLVGVVMYMPVLVSCMRTFQCSGTILEEMTFDKQKDVFLLDTDSSCRTFMFQLIHSIAVLFLVIVILGTFLLVFFMLRQRKWQLLDKDWMLYSPIYESYKTKYCFWEAVILIRILVCIMITESHPVKPYLQVSIQLGMTLVYLLSVMIFRPYRPCFWKYRNLNNHIFFEVISNLSVLLLQVVGLAIVTGHYKEVYTYIPILSVAAILLVWLILVACMKCEFETETSVEVANVDATSLTGEETTTSSQRQTAQLVLMVVEVGQEAIFHLPRVCVAHGFKLVHGADNDIIARFSSYGSKFYKGGSLSDSCYGRADETCVYYMQVREISNQGLYYLVGSSPMPAACKVTYLLEVYSEGHFKPVLPDGVNWRQNGRLYRISGSVTGAINGLELGHTDILAFVVSREGRFYISFNFSTHTVARLLMFVATQICEFLGLIFTACDFTNYTGHTGIEISRTARIHFESGNSVDIRQEFSWFLRKHELILDSHISGNVPPAAENVSSFHIDNYQVTYEQHKPDQDPGSKLAPSSILEKGYPFMILIPILIAIVILILITLMFVCHRMNKKGRPIISSVNTEYHMYAEIFNEGEAQSTSPMASVEENDYETISYFQDEAILIENSGQNEINDNAYITDFYQCKSECSVCRQRNDGHISNQKEDLKLPISNETKISTSTILTDMKDSNTDLKMLASTSDEAQESIESETGVKCVQASGEYSITDIEEYFDSDAETDVKELYVDSGSINDDASVHFNHHFRHHHNTKTRPNVYVELNLKK